MTRFAAPKIIACPTCNAYLHQLRIATFHCNPSAVRYWTDGVHSSGFEVIKSPLLHCPECATPFWKNDAKVIGELPDEPRKMDWFDIIYAKLTGDKERKFAAQRHWETIPEEIKSANTGKPTNIGDWLTILYGSAGLSPERESITRRKLWQEGNNHLRLRSDGTPWVDSPKLANDFVKQNMLALLHLHERNFVNDPIEKAEILRQLGRFDEARGVLETIRSDHLTMMASQIRMLIDFTSSEVQLVNYGEANINSK